MAKSVSWHGLYEWVCESLCCTTCIIFFTGVVDGTTSKAIGATSGTERSHIIWDAPTSSSLERTARVAIGTNSTALLQATLLHSQNERAETYNEKKKDNFHRHIHATATFSALSFVLYRRRNQSAAGIIGMNVECWLQNP